jgi:hypothetical protein
MKTTIILGLLILFISCSKQENPPAPDVYVTVNNINQTDTTEISVKVVRFEVKNYDVPSSSSFYVSNGVVVNATPSLQKYTFELFEDRFATVSSVSQTSTGSPYIDVYVNNILTHTEYGSNGSVTYQFRNDHN